jgi:TonB family protein
LGQVTHVAVHLGEIRRREMRRMLAFSLASHVVLLALLLVKPSKPVAFMPGVVSVELVAAPAPASPPRAAPRAAPPAPPVPKKVVLPAEPTTPKPKPEPKPKAVVEKAPPPEPAPVEQEYSDVLAQLRADAGEDAAEPAQPAPTATAGIGSGVGIPVSPEVAAWVKAAKIHVRRAWVLPPAFRTQAIEAHVSVDLDAGGNVIGDPEVVRRSGNPWFDDGVVHAIQKATPLPPPPAAGEWPFVFVPGDSY